jgi:hypothetical protein
MNSKGTTSKTQSTTSSRGASSQGSKDKPTSTSQNVTTGTDKGKISDTKSNFYQLMFFRNWWRKNRFKSKFLEKNQSC